MSYEPSQEDIYRADPYLAVQDMKAQLAAEKRDFDSLSDTELNKLADDYRVDVSQMQSQYTGIPGLGGKRIAQKTFAEIVRGDRKQKSTAPLGPSAGAAPKPERDLPPAAFESKDYSILLQEKLAELDLQREQSVVSDAVPPAPEATPAPESTAPRPRVKPAAPSRSSSTSGLSTVGRRTTLEENEALRKALGVGEEEVSESVFDRIRSYIEDRLPEREPYSGSAPIIKQGGEKYQERLQTEMARMRTPKEIEGTGLTSPEQTNVVDRNEFNTTPIGTRLRLLAEENLRRNQEARETVKKEEGTSPKRPVSPRVLDSAAKRFEATLEAPRQEQEGTRLSFADIVEKRTRNAPKTGAAIADNEAQVGKAGSADRASQTNIIKDYLNSMGYSKQDQTKFAKYFFNTFDQDVFFNQDVIIAALKMFNKEN